MSAVAAQQTVDVRATGKPWLSRQHVVLANRPSLSSKTTVAEFLPRRSGIRLCATHKYGRMAVNGVLDDDWKLLSRYSPAAEDLFDGRNSVGICHDAANNG